jgi:hypothetical protein
MVGGERRLQAAALACLLTVAAVGCGEPPISQSSPSVVSPSPPSMSPATSPNAAASGVPFTLTFPEGWVSGTPGDVQGYLEDLANTDPTLAAQLMENVQLQTGAFVAFDASSTEPFPPNVGCVTQDVAGMAPSDVLDLAEQQNVEAIAGLPDTTVAPAADRVQLPVGEAIRVRWQSNLEQPPGEAAAVGFLFISGDLVVTCVFTSGVDTVDEHEPEWRSILATFAGQ